MGNFKKTLKEIQKETDEAKLDGLKIIKELSNIISITSNVDSKASKFVSNTGIAISVATAAKSFYDFYKKKLAPKDYTIKISENDRAFEVVEKWLMDSLPEDQQRSVFARSNMVNDGEIRDVGYSSEAKVHISLSFDGTVEQEVDIAGHIVKISTTTPENYGKKDKSNSQFSFRIMNLTCSSFEAQKAIRKQLEKEAQSLATKKPSFHISQSWGGFRTISDAPVRSLDSVILKEGQKERIITFLKAFLANEEAHKKVGMPWHTGVLLSGEPGTGKSSLATAIASHLKLDIYFVSLSAVEDDNTLIECFTSVKPRSIVIIEDIDIAHAVKVRDDGSKGVTMSGILNVLDGLQSTDGVITIMTTNHINVLDPAIIRPGRVDLLEVLDSIDDYQMRGLCKHYMGYVPDDLTWVSKEQGITSAEIVGIFRNHVPNFANAEQEIISFVNNKIPLTTT